MLPLPRAAASTEAVEPCVESLHGLQEYEDKAVELGLNHSKRLGLRQRLKSVRLSCPLFDTTQWVKDLEKIYFKMWDIHCEGQGPRTFDVV